MSGQGPSTHGTQEQSNVKNVKGITRLTAVFVAMVMAFSCLAIVNGSDDSYAEEQKCGTSVYWGIEGDTLTLFGTGDTDNYTNENQPWYSSRTSVKHVMIMGGITRLGNYLLADLTNLETIGFEAVTDYLTSIGDGCFYRDGQLRSVSFPSTLTSIGAGAFRESGIVEMTIPSGVTSVSDNCFNGCSSLTTVNLNNATSIGFNAFRENTSLVHVNNLDSVTVINMNAFYNCTNLGDLHFSAALSTLGNADAFGSVHFCDLNMVEIDKTKDNLKGKTFYRANDKHVLTSDSLVHEGSAYTMSADSASIEVSASDVKYLSYTALSDPSVTMKFGLKDGISVTFDNKATIGLTSAGTMSVTAVDSASLDEKTKDLVGSDPVYDISFGSNTTLNGGKMTVVLPYTKSTGDVKVHFIKDGKVMETYDCTCADGKVTFTTDHMSLYSISSDGSSGGKFPVWAIVIIILVVLAAAGGAAAFFIMKNRKGGQPTEASRPKPAESPVVATPEPEKVSGSIYEAVPAEPEPVKEEPVPETPEQPEPVKEEPAPVEEAPMVPVTEDVPAVLSEPVPEVKEEKSAEKKQPVGNAEDDLDPSGSNDW